MATALESETSTLRQADEKYSPSSSDVASPPPSPWMPVVLLAAVYAIPIAVALRPIVDPDIWWHLRIGQWVCEHRAVPLTDPCSLYGADKPWIAYSWLFEVLVYRLYVQFGLTGILAYRVVMSVAVVAALHRLIRRRQPSFLVATVLTAVAALTMAPMLNARPWLFTMLFMTLTLDVLLDWRDGRATPVAWLLPIIYVLWANLHIQFVYGLFLLGLACVTLSARSVSEGERGCVSAPSAFLSGRLRNPARLKWLYGLTGLCLLATLVNPYHIQLYRVVMEYATQSAPFHCINELRALEFREMPDWVGLFLGAAAVFALGRRQRVSPFELLLLASAAIFAFRARRDLWWLVLASTAILASREHKRPELSSGRLCSRLLTISAASLLLAGLIGVLAWKRDLSEENMRRKVAAVFPVEAAALVAERGYPGPLFNDFNWGGFLIWSLPQLPVVLDGRTNLHGDERILRIVNTWSAGPDWLNDPDLKSARVILADVNSPLGCVLVLDERFQLVHEDAVARVFVRKRPGQACSHREDTGRP